jgi:hypothetical protein
MSEVVEQPAEAGTIIPGEAVAPAPDVSDVETRAKAMGWVDKDQYRGDPDKWRSADEFVKRGEEELPILRERSRDLARKTADLETKLQQQQREFADRAARHEKLAVIALQQQRATLEQQYAVAKRDAVSLGDVQRFDQLERDQQQALRQFDDGVYRATEQQPRPQNQGPSPEETAKLLAWQTANPWFFADAAMNQYAQAVHMQLNVTKPGLSIEENLAEVAKTVRQNFPDKFGPTGGRAPAVEGGNGLSTGSKRSKGFADLPAEARSAAEQFVRAGAFKTTADYAKAYWASEG